MRDKTSVGGVKMSVADGIAEARHMSDFLLSKEFRGPGDTIEAAAYRAEKRWGVPATIIQRLRHRDVSDMLMSNWWRLKAAYDAACVHQERMLRHELELAKAGGLNAANSALTRAAIRLAGPENEAAS